jgi:MFS family permease
VAPEEEVDLMRSDQAPREPETRTFQRTRRSVAAGAMIGAVIGAAAGAIIGGLVHGWWTTAMWGWTIFGLIGATGVGFFIGGMSSLEDPRRGDEPLPDAETRGDTDLPRDTTERRTGLPPQDPNL